GDGCNKRTSLNTILQALGVNPTTHAAASAAFSGCCCFCCFFGCHCLCCFSSSELV
ncbi:unnamed protein product, partial [Brassica napus]